MKKPTVLVMMDGYGIAPAEGNAEAVANTANLDFAISFLKQEMERVELLGVTKLVLHPGTQRD